MVKNKRDDGFPSGWFEMPGVDDEFPGFLGVIPKKWKLEKAAKEERIKKVIFEVLEDAGNLKVVQLALTVFSRIYDSQTSVTDIQDMIWRLRSNAILKIDDQTWLVSKS